MRIASGKLLTEREIITGCDYAAAVQRSPFTVYIGMYNAKPFLISLLKDLEAQSIKDFPLIIVDNASTDDTWRKIISWPTDLINRAKLIRNPINLGGTGSFALNSYQIETEWYVSVHQDDTYKPKHLEVLSRAISKARESDLVVFTDMGTQDMLGKQIFTPIRQSWVANLKTPPSSFIANLVQQSVSYPSSAFRTSAMSTIQIPWHSSSFPDTEITLLQASMGSFRYVPKVTMLYRMNPNSESHDLNPKERVLGPFAALSRVMASDSFLRLCLSVPERDRSSFAESVLEGVDLRLGTSSFSEIVKLIASETMGLAWDYSDTTSREQILQTYKLAEDGRTTKLLLELGALYDEGQTTKEPPKAQLHTEAQIELEKLLSAVTPPSNAQAGGTQRIVLTLIGRILPLSIRRKIVLLVVRLYTKLSPTSPWNLSWKPKS